MTTEPIDEEQEVAAALQRETADGPGFKDESELPPSDWQGYADPDADA